MDECSCQKAREAYWKAYDTGDANQIQEAWTNRGKAIYICFLHGYKHNRSDA